MITLTRADRDALVSFVLDDLDAVTRQFTKARAERVRQLSGGDRGRALELADTYDGLAARPVLEFPPLGLRPGRVIHTKEQ